jgi:hypothetical protein
MDKVEAAVMDLRDAGFTKEQIGFAVKQGTVVDELESVTHDANSPTAAAESGQTGAVLGGVLGGILGVAIAGMMPGVGAVILGAMLASIGSGALVGGLVGTLVGLGIPEEEARLYQQEFEAGRPIVTVQAGDRYSEAVAILSSHGALDVTRPVQEPAIKGDYV